MADGVAPTGETFEVATDDAGVDGHVQLFKLAVSADGSAVVVPATLANGLLVDDSRYVVEDDASVGGEKGPLVMAQRRDADTALIDADGDFTPLIVNSQGFLKVSTHPGTIDAVSGNITAVAQNVMADVSRASNVVIYVTGTFAAFNGTFEGSIDGGTSWFAIQAVRTNANTVELTTSSISAAPAYAWELSVNAFTHVRLRATALTSGTVAVRILPGVYATEPIPAIQPHSITGTVATSMAAAATSPSKAEDAVHAAGDVGFQMLGVRYETAGTAPTSAAGDYGFVQVDDLGKLVVNPYAPHVNQKYAALAAITDTTATALFAAAGAGIRTYLTSITLVNTSGVASVVEIRDNAAVMHRVYVPANDSAQFNFPNPLRGTANTAMNVALVTTATNTFISATAYNAL